MNLYNSVAFHQVIQ
ncbi:hypothetical protein IJ425_07075 [bacterium]|nr:hypothetical protein [bacterium]